jgi:flagellar biosynthesis/type III secretory pathway M-ring protein FliF/YscJ
MAPRSLRLAEIAGGFVLFFLMALALIKIRGKQSPPLQLSAALAQTAMLKPGSRVAELEAAMDRAALPPVPGAAAGHAALSSDPSQQVRDRARELAATDPQRAAHILRAWMNVDTEEAKRA